MSYLLPQQRLVFTYRNGAELTKKYDTLTTLHQRAITRDDMAKRSITQLNAEFTKLTPATVKPAISRAWNA